MYNNGCLQKEIVDLVVGSVHSSTAGGSVMCRSKSKSDANKYLAKSLHLPIGGGLLPAVNRLIKRGGTVNGLSICGGTAGAFDAVAGMWVVRVAGAEGVAQAGKGGVSFWFDCLLGSGALVSVPLPGCSAGWCNGQGAGGDGKGQPIGSVGMDE